MQQRRRVLVADDDADVREQVTEVLTDAGFAPVTVSNGVEALAVLRASERPLVLLVDLHMPQMGGEALCAACDTDPSLAAIPRILISATPDGASRVRQCGAYVCISKPIEPEVLLTALEAALDFHSVTPNTERTHTAP